MKKLFNYIPLLLSISISLAGIFLWTQNPGRTIILFLLTWAWFLAGRFFKSYFLSSLLFLVVVFPFNITINIEGFVDPYVKGVLTNYLIPHLSVLDLGAIFLCIGVIVDKKNISFQRGLLLLFAILITSFAMNPSMVSLVLMLRYILYGLTVVFIYANREYVVKKLDLIAYTLLFSVVLQLGISVYQVFTSSMIGLSWLGESQIVSGAIGSSFITVGGSQYLRAYGTFPHPNVLAGFLLFTIAFTKAIDKKWLKYILMTLALVGIFLTFSRLHIVLALLLSIVQFLPRIKGFGGFVLTERFASLLSGADISISERLSLMKVALTNSIKSIFGVGQGNFVKVFESDPVRTASSLLLLQPVHNIFLLYIVEHGILLGTLISLIILSKWFWKYFKKDFFKLGILFSLLLISMFDHYLATLPQGIFILMLSIL